MLSPKVDADTAGIRNSLNESFVSNSGPPRPDAGWTRASDSSAGSGFAGKQASKHQPVAGMHLPAVSQLPSDAKLPYLHGRVISTLHLRCSCE